MNITRLALVVLLLGTVGCSSATHIRATAKYNPLDRVEQKAQEDWSIDRVDTNTLDLSKFWPGYSISALGYAASLADLVYDHADSVLYVPYYFKIISPFYLFIPTTHDADHRRSEYKYSWSLSRRMNDELDDTLRWSGASVISGRGGKLSETFPQREPILLQPKVPPLPPARLSKLQPSCAT